MSAPSGSSLPVGTVINEKWVILERIGKGAMGEIYRAHQLHLNRDVVIKIISREWIQSLDGNAGEIEISLQRFRREIQAMAQLQHPNIVQIFDCGSLGAAEGSEAVSLEYIAMEYVPGGTLRASMSEDGFYPDEGLTKEWLSTYFLPLLDGVQAMHALGIVHRDLKPANVLLDGATPKITDFGLARSGRLAPVTQSVDLKGTLCYMSPEQVYDLKRADQLTDIYALGKILLEAVSGVLAPQTFALKRARLPTAETAFFQAIDRIIQEATTVDKAGRTPSVEALRQAVAQALNAKDEVRRAEKREASTPGLRPRPARLARSWPLGRFVPGLLLVMVLGLIGVATLLLRHPGPPPVAPGHGSASGRLEEAGNPEDVPALENRGDAPSTPALQGHDGAVLHHVPGGTLPVPMDAAPDLGLDGAASVAVQPFYLDEAPVTNHQYVEFLNQVLPMLRVEEGVVRAGDKIWFLLGNVMEGYEPIVFRGGRFRVADPMHTACAVLRVTGYGAVAYARFQGRRLPTGIEWLHAVQQGRSPAGEPAPIDPTMDRNRRDDGTGAFSETGIPVPTPVLLLKPNALGLRGLDGGRREWAQQGLNLSGVTGLADPRMLVAGGSGMVVSHGALDVPIVLRHPWEAFEDVGFRCAQDTSEN
jgi:serine/threonine-protein kinase